MIVQSFDGLTEKHLIYAVKLNPNLGKIIFTSFFEQDTLWLYTCAVMIELSILRVESVKSCSVTALW